MQIKTAMRYHLAELKMAIFKKKNIYIYILQAINARKSVEEREPSYTVDGDVNWYNPYAKQYGGSSKKLKIELPNCSLTHLLVISLYP